MSETQYLINEAQMLLLAMMADTDAAEDVRAEIIEIVKAWRRGHLLPWSEVPRLQILYGCEFDPPPQRNPPSLHVVD